MINAIYRPCCRDKGKKTPQSLSFSVSQGCEVCSIKSAPTSCQSNQHAFHRCISHRPLESVSHCRHSPTGTIILDTKEQKMRKGETKTYAKSSANSKPINDVPLRFTAPRLCAPFHGIFSIFGSALFPPRREFNQG